MHSDHENLVKIFYHDLSNVILFLANNLNVFLNILTLVTLFCRSVKRFIRPSCSRFVILHPCLQGSELMTLITDRWRYTLSPDVQDGGRMFGSEVVQHVDLSKLRLRSSCKDRFRI